MPVHLSLLLLCFLPGEERPNDKPLDPTKAVGGLFGTSLPADFVPFSADAPWNTPIPDDPLLDRRSTGMMQLIAKKTGPLIGNLTEWTIPLFVIDAASAPKVDVATFRSDIYYTVDPDGNGIAEQIPLPEGVWADVERDGHLLLVDPNLRRTWDFSRFHYDEEGKPTASRIDSWDLDDTGVREPFSGPAWWTSGARASGFPLIMGLIRPEHIQAGYIPHALAFAAPDIRRHTYNYDKTQVCLPANRSDGQELGRYVLPMGIRIQLDPDLDLDELGLSEPTKVIARAMQEYGMFLADGSSRFKIYFQNLGPDHNGEDGWSRFGTFEDLAAIPATAFRVIKCQYAIKEP